MNDDKNGENEYGEMTRAKSDESEKSQLRLESQNNMRGVFSTA